MAEVISGWMMFAHTACACLLVIAHSELMILVMFGGGDPSRVRIGLVLARDSHLFPDLVPSYTVFASLVFLFLKTFILY